MNTTEDLFAKMCLAWFIIIIIGLIIHPLLALILGILFPILWIIQPRWFIKLCISIFYGE